ncbi:Nramp family divalent metal transporter [Aestuariibacter sp. AA17]|uniref:Nramp family divalent metal transporter n=1 Tax=Fluctibacter corallii TaxID=2984329 RepID=A0ABT3ADP3_9ALTE|nr:Nramp family divalent metal transporter [Aestuariibacter sp. AA17]MCV2886432.1 Nramp family divalent metal transporter [Aestuariibacter sp. AA17]
MKKWGSGLFVTAAFIGPGTVTTASVAGAQFGYALLWALMLSVIATVVLQEMASRLGMVTRQGLAETLRDILPSGLLRILILLLIVGAVGLGNAAYQSGNITGAALGISQSIGGSMTLWSLIIPLIASLILLSGKYPLIEKALIGLVGIMSGVFLVTMYVTRPDWGAMIAGLTSPSIPDGAVLVTFALIGTTIVPYNLFLHASVVAKQQTEVCNPTHLRHNRIDSAISIGAGGLITFAVMSCAASVFFASGLPIDAGNIGHQLTPLLGDWAGHFFSLGLFSAGLTSAITAPLAGAYAVCGALGWSTHLNSRRFQMTWLVIMWAGALVATMGFKPLAAIVFAQAANGLLLPIIAIFLIWAMNKATSLGEYKNGILSNSVGSFVVLFVVGLGVYRLFTAF